MNNSLERFQIAGLHGNKNIDVKIKENTLILVGENGSGKTTFLRILFNFLSGRWLSLVQFQFDYIVATVDGIEHTIKHEELTTAFERADRRFLGDLPLPIRKRIIEFIEAGQKDRTSIGIELRKMCDHYGISFLSIMNRLETLDDTSKGQKEDIQRKIQVVRSSITAQILYLPTYRRIERELGSIFEGIDLDDFRHRKGVFRKRETDEEYIELVEFGMKDVQMAIERVLGNLKEFARESLNNLTLGYLGDIVQQKYLNDSMMEIADISDDTVASVLNRIDESILTKEQKKHVNDVIHSARSNSSPSDHSMIIFHYFLKLLQFQALLNEKESSISKFCSLCSEYIDDKQFIYNATNFTFSITPKDEKDNTNLIELSDLSSGEKQIVSLFSHLYLSGLKSYFVLIDEPELSLSVQWQRRFLTDIRKGGFCAGLVAVTHSPFIYDNELKPYARSLGEFVNI